MTDQMLAVMQRRGELKARIATQREQLAEAGMYWQKPLALADQGLAVARYLRARPVLVAGGVALLIIRRRGLMGLVRSGWLVWRGYRYFTAVSGKLASRS